MLYGDKVNFTYKTILGVQNREEIDLSDNIMSEIVMPDEIVCQKLSSELRSLSVQELKANGTIFAARNLLIKHPDAIEISMQKANAAVENNAFDDTIDSTPESSNTFTKEVPMSFPEESTGEKNKKSSNAKKGVIIALIVIMIIALIGGGVAFWLLTGDMLKASDTGKDSEEETTASEIDQDEPEDTEDELVEDEPDKKPENVDISSYIGYWHMENVLEKELTIHTEENGVVYFSLEYYESDKITNVASKLRENVALFVMASDGMIIKGELTFADDTVTVDIFESTRAGMPVETMVFNVHGMTSSFPLEEDKPVEEEDDKDDSSDNNGEDTEAPLPDTSSRVVIANGGLNMRSGPTTSASVITLIPNGNIVTVEKIENNWAYVYFNGNYGWCSCDYLFIPFEYTGELICSATVRCEGVLEMISVDYVEREYVYTDIPNGTTVYVYLIENDTVFVKYNNIYGWCPAEYLELH